ncbi:MAG: ATPase, partial [Chloroflexota bacterium]|nr:ATPase [Chloroflexota bacterium]
MDERGDAQEPPSGTADILYLVDRLEELVGMGKRVPLSNRVMVEEEEFLSLVDQLRVAVPNEIKQAQRVIKERERIIGEAQDEARAIVKAAQDRAELLLSQHGVLAEARVRGEEILRRA